MLYTIIIIYLGGIVISMAELIADLKERGDEDIKPLPVFLTGLAWPLIILSTIIDIMRGKS